ncbi:hypothetical protein [Streptomyces nigra]|uniref:hypothetical protein n=1 Tax=Streptomyces nigra TaxID=1827580 RepID=UPI003443C41F
MRAARPQDLVGQARLDVAYGASEHHRADEPAEQQHRLVAGLPRSEFSVALAVEFRAKPARQPSTPAAYERWMVSSWRPASITREAEGQPPSAASQCSAER